MINNSNSWEKVGRIIKADPKISWMSTYTGPSFGIQKGKDSLFDIYITGRDDCNRSLIGKMTLDIENPTKILSISESPIFSYGELGTFDENGVSYPVIVENNDTKYMYYVGWMPTKLTPFQNFPGLAMSKGQTDDFKRYSRAPILERTDDEPFCTGSLYVLKEEKWKMWYTSFLKWGEEGEHKHYYVIKYAESNDGIQWDRKGKVCIGIEDSSEYSICKPSVIKINNIYHMWYVYRGEHYKIGYAHSVDGINWTRRDDLAGIDVSKSGWDSIAMSYPHVFKYKDSLYMLYCGNNYGKEGLGLATLKL
jgi:predicted GH43/DUF377 family glycosyl hydrolase